MKLSTTFFLAVLLSTALFGQNQKLSNQLLQELQTATSPQHRNQHHQTHQHHRNCITPILMTAKQHWHELTMEAQNAFSPLLTRPTLSGEELIVYSQHFDFHFTLEGPDAVPTTDDNFNDIPDLVEMMIIILDEVYQKDSIELGYHTPPTDNGEGGTNYYDVYIGDIGNNLYGYVAPENQIGDNPMSPNLQETAAMTSFMVMNNDYSWVESDLQTSIEVTAAHELFHSIQFGYTGENTRFIMEATAAWMEDVIYPIADDNLQYLPHIFVLPDVALNVIPQDELPMFEGRWYSGWLFFKYLQEKTNADIVRRIFERSITLHEIGAIHVELEENWNTDFVQAFANYQIAALLMSSNTQHAPFDFSRAEAYQNWMNNNLDNPFMAIEGEMTFDNTAVLEWRSDVNGNGRLMRLSSDFIQINNATNDNFAIVLAPDVAETELALQVLKGNSSTGEVKVQYGEWNGQSYIADLQDASNYDIFIANVLRLGLTSQDRESEQYTLGVGILQTSTEEMELASEQVAVFPNPTASDFTIKINNLKKIERLQVVDVLGRLIQEQQLEGQQQIQVKTNNWQNGMYVVQLFDKNGMVARKKVIIEK